MIASMNAVALVTITLTRKPEQRSKASGGAYTLARGREGIGEGARFWALFAFGESARAELDRLEVGDVVAVQGSFDASVWDGRGKPEASLKINVDRAIALRPPARARKPKSTEREAAPTAPDYGEASLNDAIPF